MILATATRWIDGVGTGDVLMCALGAWVGSWLGRLIGWCGRV